MKNSYLQIPDEVSYHPHGASTTADWAAYEQNLNKQRSVMKIDRIPESLLPVKYSPELIHHYTVKRNLRKIKYSKTRCVDDETGYEYFQITRRDGWGDQQFFHPSVAYNYIPVWNKAASCNDSLLAVVAMNIDHPDYGNRVYVIPQDGNEAYCLLDQCTFNYTLCNGMPYIHVAPICWLNSQTLFVAQRNGINLRVDVPSGRIDFVPGLPPHNSNFVSPNGRYIAFAPLVNWGTRLNNAPGHGALGHSAQGWIYDFKTEKARKLVDLSDIFDLHPELDPHGFELSFYCNNFQWAPDSSAFNFFTVIFHNNRMIRDLCMINADGGNLHLIVSSEDTLRFPPDGRHRRFGNLLPSGSILNNHQAFLPNGRQIMFCMIDPFALQPGTSRNPRSPFIDTSIIGVVDTDGTRMQVIQCDDRNFGGHPTSSPDGSFWLGFDDNGFIKVMNPLTAESRKLFSVNAPSEMIHPHESFSPDGSHILWRQSKDGQFCSAPIDFVEDFFIRNKGYFKNSP